MLNRPAFPGLNFRHPALQKAIFAVVPDRSLTVIDMIGKTQGVITAGTGALSVASGLAGIGFKNTANANDYLAFSGRATVATSGPYTFGVLCRYDGGNTNTAGFICLGSNSGNAAGLGISSAQALRWNGGLDVLTSAVAAGGTYLILSSTADVSSATSTTNTVIVDLRTGAVKTATSSQNMGGTTQAGNGTWVFSTLNIVSGVRAFPGLIHSLIVNQAFMPLTELVNWAADPWGPFRVPQFPLGLTAHAAGSAGTVNLPGAAASPAAGSFTLQESASIGLPGAAASPAAGTLSSSTSGNLIINFPGAAAAPAAGAFTPSESITVNNFAAATSGGIFQRNSAADPTKTVTFTGTYTGVTPTGIDVQINVVAGGTAQVYAPLSSFSASGGTWSGTLSVRQGSYYLAAARDTLNHGVAAVQTQNWAIGPRAPFFGASNYGEFFTNTSGSPPTPDAATKVWSGTAWAAPTSDGVITMLNQMRAALGSDPVSGTPIPIGVMLFLQNGAGLASFITSNTTFWNTVTASMPDNSDCEAFFINQAGMSGDGSTSSPRPSAFYPADYADWKGKCQSVTGRSNGNSIFGLVVSGAGGGTDVISSTQVHDQQQIQGLSGAPWFIASVNLDLETTDGIHFVIAGYVSQGARHAQAWLNQLGLSSRSSVGPIIKSFSRKGAVLTLRLQNPTGSGLALPRAPGSLPIGFEVNTDPTFVAADLTITGFAILSATRATITLSADPGATTYLRYLWGSTNTANVQNNLLCDSPVVAADAASSGNPALTTGATVLTQSAARSGGGGGMFLIRGLP